MPFCPQCGIDNPDSARFCDQCGATLVPVTAPAAAAAQAPTPTGTPAPVLSAGPTSCPQCGQSVLPGEAFCDNCGAPLSAPARPAGAVPQPPYSPNLPPQPSYPAPQPAQPAVPPITQATPPVYTPPPAPAPSYTPPPAPSYTPPAPAPSAPRSALAPARLVVVATGAALPLPSGTQAIVGRADPVSQFAPDVDLNAHGALEQGVGRRHARIFVQGGQAMVEDLDSTNGTVLNGRKLAPRQPEPLRDGDTLQLGRLALQFLP